jgi:hypothetical protein
MGNFHPALTGQTRRRALRVKSVSYRQLQRGAFQPLNSLGRGTYTSWTLRQMQRRIQRFAGDV